MLSTSLVGPNFRPMHSASEHSASRLLLSASWASIVSIALLVIGKHLLNIVVLLSFVFVPLELYSLGCEQGCLQLGALLEVGRKIWSSSGPEMKIGGRGGGGRSVEMEKPRPVMAEV